MIKTVHFIKILPLLFLFLSMPIFAKGWVNPAEAVEASKISHKPVLVFVYKEGCPACEDISMRFAKEDFYHAILQGFELSKISVDEVKKQFNMDIDRTPTFIFIDSDHNELAPMVEGSPSNDLEFSDYLLRVQVVAERLQQLNSAK